MGAGPHELDERDGLRVGRDEGRSEEEGLSGVGEAAAGERVVGQRARKAEREARRRVLHDLVEQLAGEVRERGGHRGCGVSLTCAQAG